MADDNKNLASDTERTSILPQSEPQVAEQTEVLPTPMNLRRKRLRCHRSPSRRGLARSPTRPWSLSRRLLPPSRRATRLWLLAPRQGSLHRRNPRGASARPLQEPPRQSSPSASARASSRMRPLWAMVRTSTSRATKTVSATRVTVTRTVISAPAVSSRVTASSRVPVTVSKARVMVSRRVRARNRAMLAALARDLLRRVAEAPAASLEARAVLTPQPRMRVRPPAER